MTDEDQTLIEYTYTYVQCIHIYISIFSLIFANSLLFWSFYTWLILVIYSLTNKEYMFTCLVFCSDT
jgi:hypothetical protein